MESSSQTELEDGLEQTNQSWMTSMHGTAKFVARHRSWELTVEARNPKTSSKWRITLENRQKDETYAVGPVETENLRAETVALVEEHV